MTLNPWFVWVDLERREKQEYRAAERARGQGPRWNLDHYWILESPFPGWRVQKLHSALQSTNWRVGQRLAERLDGLDVKAIAQALAETCQDIALVWGGSALLGAGAGAVLGSLAGGVGALPGAALGAGVGTQVGAWVLGMLGLAGLLQDLGDQVPRAAALRRGAGTGLGSVQPVSEQGTGYLWRRRRDRRRARAAGDGGTVGAGGLAHPRTRRPGGPGAPAAAASPEPEAGCRAGGLGGGPRRPADRPPWAEAAAPASDDDGGGTGQGRGACGHAGPVAPAARGRPAGGGPAARGPTYDR